MNNIIKHTMNVVKLVHLLHPLKYNNYYKKGAKNVTKRTL